MDLGMAGRVALVVGASTGLGRAASELLAQEGVKVALVARREGPLGEAVAALRAAGGQAAGFTADFAAGEDVAPTIGRVVAELGEIDILVNAVAMSAYTDPLERVGRDDSLPMPLAPDDASWRRHFDTTLLATVRACRVVVPSMKRRRRGAIVNISALSSRYVRTFNTQYGTLQLAKEYFTLALAKELGGDGVRVNCVTCGYIKSVRIAEKIRELAAQKGLTLADAESQYIAERENTVWMPRMGTPEEMANVVAFLVSDRASYVNGAVWRVDGGAPAGV